MDFIKVIEDYLNVKANKVFLEIQPGDIKDTYADIDKLERYTAYRPKINIEEGLPRFINWYKSFYKL